jgi:hypothetical protein
MRIAIGRPRPRCVPRNCRKGRSHENDRVPRTDRRQHRGRPLRLPIGPEVGLVEDRLGGDSGRGQLCGTCPTLRNSQSAGCREYGTGAFTIRDQSGSGARVGYNANAEYRRRTDLSDHEQPRSEHSCHHGSCDAFVAIACDFNSNWLRSSGGKWIRRTINGVGKCSRRRTIRPERLSPRSRWNR